MPEYRRAFAPGGTFFFTVVAERRAPLFRDAGARKLLREAITQTRRRWPFDVEAIVLLPDHVHTIWSLPERDHDFSRRWSFLKRTFTKAWLLNGGLEQPTSGSRKKNRRRGVWQRRFWEHLIRDENDFARHCDYIHYNPVKHELASCPHVWPHSSFARFALQGICDSAWGCTCDGRRMTPLVFDDLDETAME